MAHYAVIWQYTEDQQVLNDAKAAHGVYLRELVSRGKIREAGPWQDGSGALLIFDVDDEAELKALLEDDPYTSQGVVRQEQIFPWKVVIGPLAP